MSRYSPGVNSVARSESAVAGCIAAGRPNWTMTLPPWKPTMPRFVGHVSGLVLSLWPMNGLGLA
ncbi:hypothetical protein ACIRG5_22650 [Lentzea sp. NPDC102401]|uniref:hypothetical protein n=1 Tax=Lentzea sp. NPDC102401 TaxID=3364128 RepID=UPI00382EC598